MELEPQYALRVGARRHTSELRHIRTAVFFFLGMLMQSSVANDFLSDTGPVEVEFVITDHLRSPTVAVSVTFSADGLQQLGPSGSLTVNGLPIEAKRLQKQGYWYTSEIPKSKQYELAYRRSARSPVIRSVVIPRKFIPTLPPMVSKRAGLRVGYDGPPLLNTEVAMASFKYPEGGNRSERWGFTISGTVRGNEIIFAPTALQEIQRGHASLLVGISCEQQSDKADHALVYAVNHEAPVTVVD